LAALRHDGTAVRILFLEASDEVLLRRYRESRRRHPFSEGSLSQAIATEREALQSVKGDADLVVDTSSLNVHQLKARVQEAFATSEAIQRMRTSVVSFGYKWGLPTDVDLVIDCRFLPNPYWVPELRPLRGTDATVRDHVLGHPDTTAFLERLGALLELLVPAYVREGKAYLTIAFGCTGGHHRSVAVAEAVGRMLGTFGVQAQVGHRDIDR